MRWLLLCYLFACGPSQVVECAVPDFQPCCAGDDSHACCLGQMICSDDSTWGECTYGGELPLACR